MPTLKAACVTSSHIPCSKLTSLTAPNFKGDWGLWSGCPPGGNENGVGGHISIFVILHHPGYQVSIHFTPPVCRISKCHIIPTWNSNSRISGRLLVVFIISFDVDPYDLLTCELERELSTPPPPSPYIQ